MEVGEDLPDHRLQLRIGVLKRPVGGHVFDDVSQDRVDFPFLRAKQHFYYLM